MMREATTMEEEMALAEELLRSIMDFLENGNVETLVEGEVVNYFQMCKQIEIYNEKFQIKGYFMSMDVNTGSFSLSRSNAYKSKYDLDKLADRLFMKFSVPTCPAVLLSKALSVFMKDFGSARLRDCVEAYSGFRHSFNLEYAFHRACKYRVNVEAALLMEGFETILSRPTIGIRRVTDLLRELIIEDECAETVVTMFAIHTDLDVWACREIKKILLGHLREKFARLPHAKLWLKMVGSYELVDSISVHEQFLDFVLDLIRHLSVNIRCIDAEKKKFYSPPGSLDYDQLVQVIIKCYQNKQSCQKIINFIFNQCVVNPTVWHSVLDSCHSMQAIEMPPLAICEYTAPGMISFSRALEGGVQMFPP